MTNLKQPVNCGATVPRVKVENLREAKIAGLYCSRIGSTESLITCDAACAPHTSAEWQTRDWKNAKRIRSKPDQHKAIFYLDAHWASLAAKWDQSHKITWNGNI